MPPKSQPPKPAPKALADRFLENARALGSPAKRPSRKPLYADLRPAVEVVLRKGYNLTQVTDFIVRQLTGVGLITDAPAQYSKEWNAYYDFARRTKEAMEEKGS